MDRVQSELERMGARLIKGSSSVPPTSTGKMAVAVTNLKPRADGESESSRLTLCEQ
jgi:hypothetical protein